MQNNAADTNNDAAGYVQVGEWDAGAEIDRGLFQFDLTSIPTGVTVQIATFRLYDEGTALSSNTRTMRVYRCRRVWGETTSTWNSYDTALTWQTAGASGANDREATDIGSISMPATEVAGYNDITLTASSIQEMIPGGSFTNNGFVLQMDTEVDDMHRFSNRGDANQEPLLVVTYITGSGLQSKYW